MKPLLSLLASLVLVPAAAAQAQDLSKPGPFTTSWRDVSFQLPGGAIHTGRVYYPAVGEEEAADADLSGAPYPLASFCHGSLSKPGDFDELSHHVASWGWVLVSVPEGIENANIAAGRAEKLLQWADEQSTLEESFLAGMVSTEHVWASMGHSMGGASLQYLVAKEPKVRVLIAFAPGFDQLAPKQPFQDFDGSLLVVAGTNDVTTPTNTVTNPYYKEVVAPRRKAFVEIEGGGHYEAADKDADIQFGDTLPHNQGHRWIRLFATSFLFSEVHGDDVAIANVLGDGAESGEQAVERRGKFQDPAAWAAPSWIAPGQVNAGIVGVRDDVAVLLVSPEPGPLVTPWGELAVGPDPVFFLVRDVLEKPGYLQQTFAVQRAFASGPLYLQGVAIDERGARFTKPIELFAR